MNTVVKSVLIGLVLGIAAYFIAGMLEKDKTARDRYAVQCTLQIGPKNSDDANGMSGLVVNTEGVIRQRIERAGYSIKSIHRVNNANSTPLLDVIVNDVTDTAEAIDLISSEGLLQFWETYDLNEVGGFLTIADTVALALFPPEKKEQKKDDREQIAPEVRQLLDSIDASKQEETVAASGTKKFIELDNYATRGTIGNVKTEDTANLGKILRSEKVVASLPVGARFCFSLTPIYKKEYRSLHLLKTKGRETALLQSKDISFAKMDYYDGGNPFVSFEFSRLGAAKWETLTRENTGRAIAITFDDHVISAPVVESAITGGKAQISGGFSVQQCEDMVNKLQTGVLPARVSVLNYRVTREGSVLSLRNILFALLVFGVATVLSWFVLKSLKST